MKQSVVSKQPASILRTLPPNSKRRKQNNRSLFTIAHPQSQSLLWYLSEKKSKSNFMCPLLLKVPNVSHWCFSSNEHHEKCFSCNIGDILRATPFEPNRGMKKWEDVSVQIHSMNHCKYKSAALVGSYIFGEHINVTFHRHIKRNITWQLAVLTITG